MFCFVFLHGNVISLNFRKNASSFSMGHVKNTSQSVLPYAKVVNTARKGELGGKIVIFTLNVVFLSMGYECGYIGVWLRRRIWQCGLCVCSLYYLMSYNILS